MMLLCIILLIFNVRNNKDKKQKGADKKQNLTGFHVIAIRVLSYLLHPDANVGKVGVGHKLHKTVFRSEMKISDLYYVHVYQIGHLQT